MRNIYSASDKRSQSGSTLIAVLFILILITIIGVLAMKQGLISLGIATNSQVQTVLAEAADAPLNQFAQTDPTTVTSIQGVLGAAINNAQSLGQEYVFCYRPTASDAFGLAADASLVQGNPDGTVTSISGTSSNYCDLTSDFGSGRKATVTQVAVSIPTDTSSLPPLTNSPNDGTDISVGSPLPKSFTTQQRIRVTSTSMLPAFSATALSTVQADCVQGRISDNSDPSLSNVENMTDCLAREGVPANTQVQEYSLQTTLSSN